MSLSCCVSFIYGHHLTFGHSEVVSSGSGNDNDTDNDAGNDTAFNLDVSSQGWDFGAKDGATGVGGSCPDADNM